MLSNAREDFDNAVEFGHNVARVTATGLRAPLERFARLCSNYSLPPHNWNDVSQDEALAVQDSRFHSLMSEASQIGDLLGKHLRHEIDRHNTSQ